MSWRKRAKWQAPAQYVCIRIYSSRIENFSLVHLVQKKAAHILYDLKIYLQFIWCAFTHSACVKVNLQVDQAKQNTNERNKKKSHEIEKKRANPLTNWHTQQHMECLHEYFLKVLLCQLKTIWIKNSEFPRFSCMGKSDIKLHISMPRSGN